MKIEKLTKPGQPVPPPTLEDIRRIATTAWPKIEKPLVDSDKTKRARELTRDTWTGDIDTAKPTGRLVKYIEGKWKKLKNA